MTDINTVYTYFKRCSGISTDTRNIKADSMFFCLKGTKFDANQFASDALQKGAKYVVVDNPEFQLNENCLFVDDTLKTLQQLANLHRKKLQIPFIGITGTNGKTTTKELIKAALSIKYKTHATSGNLNNHIGVPLTILSIPVDSEIAIIEMGANHPLEIKELSEIAEPEYGLITSIGKAHLEGFGSIEGVINTKKELYDFVSTHGGKVFVPSNSDVLLSISQNLDRIVYGDASFADYSGKICEDESITLNFEVNGIKIHSNLVGQYNFINLMAAYALARFFGISINEFKKAIEDYMPQNQRSQLIKLDTNTIILDAYNANPTSMEAALFSFQKTVNTEKSVILGDMLELGSESIAEHKRIIEILKNMSLKNIVLIGPVFHSIPSGFDSFENTQQAMEFLKSNVWKNQNILIKGSRGIAVEKVLEIFG